MRSSGTVATAVLVSMCVTGCSRSPSVNVLGAYFPDWLFCIIAGVVLTIIFHVIVQRTHRGLWFGPPALVYPALVTLLALVVWLIFFQH
ncbi:YtcA family lipoprotein [Caballeronia sp. LjRoot31]|uniref:YtcA family lipoprotein n=1 Tax=Caballeronia sp. LjRoot31 TaxID=3342324 RepID=UPI003ECF40DF